LRGSKRRENGVFKRVVSFCCPPHNHKHTHYHKQERKRMASNNIGKGFAYCVLITGGTRGLGLAAAGDIAKKFPRSTIVLASRTGYLYLLSLLLLSLLPPPLPVP
jgi:hypothetical protein